MKRALLALLLFCSPLSALGQGTIQQSGPVTPFHMPAWFTNGYLMDGGSPQTPYISAMGLFGGASCPLGVSSQTGPGLSTSPYALFTVCQTPTTTTINLAGVNGQPAPALFFNIGGTSFPFPGSSPTPPTPSLTAAQAITAPALVNVSATFQIAPANAATGLPANGYIATSVNMGAQVPVFFSGLASGFSDLTGGMVFLSPSTPGGVTQTPPASGSGDYVQPVGFAVTSSSIVFNPGIMNGPL